MSTVFVAYAYLLIASRPGILAITLLRLQLLPYRHSGLNIHTTESHRTHVHECQAMLQIFTCQRCSAQCECLQKATHSLLPLVHVVELGQRRAQNVE